MVATALAPMAVVIALVRLGCLLGSLSTIPLATPFFWPIPVELDGGADVPA